MLEILFVNSMVCYGVRFATSEDEVLHFIVRFFDSIKKLANSSKLKRIKNIERRVMNPCSYTGLNPDLWDNHSMKINELINSHVNQNFIIDNVTKPIYGCVNCMASVWGLAGVYTFSTQLGFGVWSLECAAYILALCGINLLTGTIIEKITRP